MITSLRVVSLLFLLFYFTETRSESCGSVQKCIRCGCLSMSPQSQRVQCNQTLKCDILNMTDTELVIACDEPDDCEEIVVEDGFSCFSRVHYSETSDKWQFVTGYATYRENCDLVGCPPPGGFTTELDEIESQVFDCHCFTNNCNRFRNVNVTQEMMQTSTDSSLMPIHTTTIGSSVIRSHVVFQSNIIMSMYPTSLFNRSILLMDSTSEPNNTAQSAEDSTAVFISIIAVLFVVMSVIFVLMLFTVCYLYRRLLSKRNQHSMNHVVQLHSNDPTSSDVANQSEHDFPFTILETIGYGRFGTVCCAIYGNATVAVKVYNSSHRAKWRKEKHIYSFESTPHENLLHCISFGQRDDGQRKQPYRISENYVLGSLDCFLKRNILSWYQTLNILHDISCGLVHLHSNKYVREGTTKDKLAVAHRDLKSANVLVKDTSGHCVLSDLGQGLVIDPLKDENEISTEQVGTYRYMAPEALDARVNLRDIESFKQIDVYALALVIWEVCTRCELSDDLAVPPYQSPYFNLVGERPTLEAMKRTVVIEKSRPDILGIWESHPGLKQIINIMEESWDEDPEARLTAANIVSRLENLERTQRKQELTKELDSTLPSRNITYTGEPQHAHRKVRVSSSFSGQPHNRLPVAQKTRRSVGSTESPHNLMQSFQRHYGRGSLPRHFELTESSLSAKGPCTVEDNVETDESTLQQLYSHDNEASMNVDAATGQHNTTALTSSDSSTTDSNTSLHSAVDNDQ